MNRVKVTTGIYLIDGVVYVEKTNKEKLYRRKAPMQGSAAINKRGNPTDALVRWKRDFDEAIVNEDWQRVLASRQRKVGEDLGEFVGIYKAEAAAEFARYGEPRPETVTANWRALMRVAQGIGAKRLNELTPAAVGGWVERYVAAGGDDGADGRRVGVWSTLRQARSCWAGWAKERYATRNFKLPECLDKWPSPKRSMGSSYVRPPEELRRRTAEWVAGLEKGNPRLWVAAVLMLDFAMRPVDAAELKWDNFVAEGGKRILRYVPSKTRGRTAGRVRSVEWPVDEGLFARLRAAGGDVYAVRGDGEYGRYNLFIRELNAGMRALGWTQEEYGKACYELRKMCVDAIYRKYGIERAAQISGDNIQTVMRYYADPRITGVEPVDVGAIV